MNKGADVTIRDTMLKSVVHAAVGDAASMAYLLQVSVVMATASVWGLGSLILDSEALLLRQVVKYLNASHTYKETLIFVTQLWCINSSLKTYE